MGRLVFFSQTNTRSTLGNLGFCSLSVMLDVLVRMLLLRILVFRSLTVMLDLLVRMLLLLILDVIWLLLFHTRAMHL